MADNAWQAYVDDSLIGSGYMHSACLIGTEDGSYWAHGGEYVPQPDEVTHIISCIKDPSKALASGITIATVKYFVVRATKDMIILKKGGSGGCICPAAQCFVLGIYGNPEAASALTAETTKSDDATAVATNNVNPADCNTTVEGIANYLKEQGY